MAHRKFAKVGDVLPSVLRALGLEQRFKEQKLLELWPAVAGEELAARTHATRVDKGILYVHVDHGAWMQELHFIEKELLKRLHDLEPGVHLKQIRFSAREVS